MRKAYVVLAGLLFLAMVVEAYLSTFGAMQRPFGVGSSMIAHAMNGLNIVPVIALLATIAAFLAKAPRRLLGETAAMIILPWTQILLFAIASLTGSTTEKTTVGGQIVLGFHALNGIAMLVLTFLIFRGARAHAATAEAPQAATA